MFAQEGQVVRFAYFANVDLAGVVVGEIPEGIVPGHHAALGEVVNERVGAWLLRGRLGMELGIGFVCVIAGAWLVGAEPTGGEEVKHMILYGCYRSQFLHGDHIDRLDVVLPGEDLIEDVVGEHLVVLDDTPELQLFDSEGHRQLLGLVVPGQTINLQGQNALGKLVQVGHLLVVDLHIEDHDRLCRGLGLGGLLGRSHLLDLLGFLGSLVFGEGVEVIISRGSSSSLLLFLLGFFGLLSGQPLDGIRGIGVDEEIPVV
jgi:hypothetical protein